VIAQLKLPLVNSTAQVAGLSGGSVDTKTYLADELSIGDVSLNHPVFYSITIPQLKQLGIYGAIGFELFSRLITRADYEHHQLTLSDPAQFSYSGNGQVFHLQNDPQQLIVAARIGKASGNFNLDSGSLGTSGITLNSWFVKQYSLRRRFVRHYTGVFSLGADGKGPQATIERIPPLCFDTICIAHHVAELSTGNSNSPYAGRIGLDILRRFTYTIDWQHRSIYLEKSSQWDRPNIYDTSGVITELDDTTSKLKVIQIMPHSPGQRAHLKVGDVILLVDGHKPIPSITSDDPAFEQAEGTTIQLTIQRGSQTLQLPLTLKDIL
jgi:hypothetical protein